jgi:GGDEF domain-containing protein
MPAVLCDWLARAELRPTTIEGADELMAIALRGRPRIVFFDARSDDDAVGTACARLKADSYTSVVPAVVVCGGGASGCATWFRLGVDEVVHGEMATDEVWSRLDTVIRRANRDLQVHPSTRLPGTAAIEAEILVRIASGECFAVCYADLDHFKEFNDRYSYYDGDRVIQLLARIQHDVVKGLCGEQGFVGHIGGDDFIFIVSRGEVPEVCEEIIRVFDALAPYQYSAADRRAGYFFGKDRRGQLHRVPLMTVSIGVVTNERRHFTSPAQVSELATEMKGYAKTLPGSVYAVDRRQDPADATPRQPDRAHSSRSNADNT